MEHQVLARAHNASSTCSISASTDSKGPAIKRALSSITTTPTLSPSRKRQLGESYAYAFTSGLIMLCSPLVVILYLITLQHFHGSLTSAWAAMTDIGPHSFYTRYSPRLSLKASLWYTAWLCLQAALYNYLPGPVHTGQTTPSGHVLRYRTNGLSAWFYTLVAWAYAIWLWGVDPTFIARNFGALVVAANGFAFMLAGLAYLKAMWSPSHVGDCRLSGSFLYDVYMGVELNPRMGKYFDLKLFTNGRPGIIAWTMIDFSFLAHSHQLHGFIPPSLLIVFILHLMHVVDFLANEASTIDSTHDAYGFNLIWGSVVWIPAMGTLQAQYLCVRPRILGWPVLGAVFALGVAVWAVSRGARGGRGLVRRTNGNCTIWGSPAQTITTTDGSPFLISVWWGLERHVNHLGDLVMAYSICLTCGFEDLLPWTYALLVTALVVYRVVREEGGGGGEVEVGEGCLVG